MTDQMQTPVAKLAKLADAVDTIEDFLKSDDAPATVSVSKEAPMTNIPYLTEVERLDQRQKELYNAEVKRLDEAYALLPEAERSKRKRETEEQIKNRLMLQGGEYKSNASRISQLSKAGFGKVEKTDEPVLSQGVVADLIDQEVDRLAGVGKSDPTYHQKRARVWAENPHLRKRYEEHRGAAV